MKLAMVSDVFNEGLDFTDLYKAIKGSEMTPEKKVSKLLYDLMLPPSYKGYRYMKDAILMLCDDNYVCTSFTKNIYPVIAEKYGSTSQNIEKNIRSAVNKIYAVNSREDLEKTLGKSPIIYDKPSNVKFITFCAEKLRLER
jgi:two-component system response regulator (stage 0 sporulation protein A)